MIFEFTAVFKEDYQNLPHNMRKKMDKVFYLLEKSTRHPSLNLEKIDSVRNIWSGRVDRGYRFTFQWIPGGMRLRKVGTHQDAYCKP
jgi:mRNA-degrading endonuclease RelE of RelBE toxin-antitoxin system